MCERCSDLQMYGLIDLSSAEGQRLLAEVKEDGTLYQPFVEQVFSKQKGRANCGLQSAAILLNASYVAKHSPASNSAEHLPFSEERMLDAEALRAVTSLDRVYRHGVTLEELDRILAAYGCTVDRNHATESTAESFREKCKTALSTNHSGVIVSYYKGALGQDSSRTHHSPLGAYHSREDRFLLWDTCPKTEVCWAKTDDLFHAMNTLDHQSNKSRGFCIIDTANMQDC